VAIDSDLLVSPDGELTEELLTAVRPLAVTAYAAASEYADAAALRVGDWSDPERRDQATEAWAYYRAFSDRAQQIKNTMQSAAVVGEVSRSYSWRQAELLQQDANKWLAKFNQLEALEFPGSSTGGASTLGRTQSKPTAIQW